MNPTSPRDTSNQIHEDTRPPAPSGPRRRAGNEDSTAARLSCPPLRRDAATYKGPDQPAWLVCFLGGELIADLDFNETARELSKESAGTEDWESWLENDENREEARYLSSGGGGIDTYRNWCVDNKEFGALLWLLGKKNEDWLTLDFQNFGMDDLGIWLEALAADVNICGLSLDNVVLDMQRATLLKDCLSRKENLVSLDIRGLQFLDGDRCPVIYLAQGIASATGLEVLKMNHCEIKGPDWIVMMEMIKDHQTLESLHIVKSEITTEDLITILQNTRANPRLRELGFYTLPLPSTGATVIAEYLAKDASLATLEIVNVDLDGASGGMIAKALAGNSTLARLNLARNGLDAEFATACRHLLEHNRRLEFLDLSENQLTDQGAEAIANGLRKNQALHVLSLDQNGIQENGGLALASMLASNAGLAELGMDDNPCGEKVGTAMAHGLETNTTLQHVSSFGCGFSDQATELIETITNRNNQARASKVRDAMVFSRHGASAASWLPPEIGGSIMNHLLMHSATNEQYQSVATVVELALNAMAISSQEKTS